MRIFRRALTTLAATALIVVASGCGDKATSVNRGTNRTIDVAMADNAYQPTDFRVAKGETVTFTFKNNGTIKHEAILGDDAAQMKHHAEMTASTGQMEHGNTDHGGRPIGGADAITVDPGKSGELTHTFNEPGSILIGCHEPGHYAAGMRIAVTVS